MGKIFILLVLIFGTLSCDNRKDSILSFAELDIIKKVARRSEKKNGTSYFVKVNDLRDNSEEIFIPLNNEKWIVPLGSEDIRCEVLTEENANKGNYIRVLICQLGAKYEVMALVSCGISNAKETETIRISIKGNPIFKITFGCEVE